MYIAQSEWPTTDDQEPTTVAGLPPLYSPECLLWSSPVQPNPVSSAISGLPMPRPVVIGIIVGSGNFLVPPR